MSMANQNDETPVKERKAVSMMSKKRFQEICDVLTHAIDDHEKVQEVIESIKDIMGFDPEVKQYTPEQGKKTMEYRRKLRDEKGVSMYISCGTKKRYDAMKASKQTVTTT